MPNVEQHVGRASADGEPNATLKQYRCINDSTYFGANAVNDQAHGRTWSQANLVFV